MTSSRSHEQSALDTALSVADPAEEDYEVLDYWGSGDSLSCLAAWG
jgi:hypothetical protein